jgi:eukaryotic-like serine/threonine-protein kinase
MIGNDVSNYHIIAKVGSGSSGVVYRATHSTLELTVALKFLSDDLLADADARRRFLRGAKAVASLEHPNVCRFYDVGTTAEGRLFLAMSFCDGPTLRDRLKQGPLPIIEALTIAVAVTDGLAHAHSRRVVHRDIKPANLMLTGDTVVKIVDFGLAALLDEATITKSGNAPGTVLYMSPEQVHGKHADARSDIFAFGGVLYEMLTGAPPFLADNAGAIMHNIMDVPHAPLGEVFPGVPESLCRVIDRALAKDPSDRYQYANEMHDDLIDVLNQIDPDHFRRKLRWPLPVLIRKWRWRALAATAIVAIGVTVTAMTDTPDPRPSFSIAIIPMIGDTSPAGRALIGGLARDVSDRLEDLTAGDARFAVPYDQVNLLRATTPERARGVLGARRVVAVSGGAGGPQGMVALTRFDVDSLAVRRRADSVALGTDVFDGDRFDRDLCRLLDMNAPRVHPVGYTASGAAYRDYLIGRGYLDAGGASLDDAIASLEHAVKTDSTFARAWAALGEGFRRRFAAAHDSASAESTRTCCARAPNLCTGLASAHVTLGELLAATHDEHAETEFRTAVALEPNEPGPIHALGNFLLFAANRPDAAEAVYARGTKAQPLDASAFESLGYLYYTQGRYEDAIGQFRVDASLAPDRQQVYNYLGACYFAGDCWDRAVAMFERSFTLNRSFVSCSNLGTLYYMDHRFVDAANMYQWAREYHPDRYDVVGYLAAAHRWIPGHRVQSDALFREAVSLAEKQRSARAGDAEFLATLAGFFPAERADSASALAGQAATLAPDDAEVQYRVALVYEEIGQREKALVHLAHAVDLGHSIRQIESEPFLDDLRKDSRFREIERNAPRAVFDCDAATGTEAARPPARTP